MLARNSLLICCTLFGLAGCESAAYDSELCEKGRCDDPSQISAQQLMPRAPQTPGAVNLTRRGQDWLFEVIGAKGEIVLLSERYASKTAARNGVLSAEENGVNPGRYEVRESGGSWSYTLRAANGQVLADSQIFATEGEARDAAESARDLVAGIVQYRAAMVSGAGFDLLKQDGKWSFELSDDEGDALVTSQRYTNRTNALTGIASVRNNGKDAGRYEILSSPPRYIIKARNGEEIAESSQSYASEDAAREAANSLQALLKSERVANPW